MGTYDPFGGTTLESLRAVAEAYGLQGLDLHENGRYKRWTLDDLRTHLRAGHPVIPQLRYRMMPGREWVWVGYDHYVVITGMVGEDFVINDPIGLNGHGERVLTGAAVVAGLDEQRLPGRGRRHRPPAVGRTPLARSSPSVRRRGTLTGPDHQRRRVVQRPTPVAKQDRHEPQRILLRDLKDVRTWEARADAIGVE